MVEIRVASYWMGVILFQSLLCIFAHLGEQLRSICEMESDLRDLLRILKSINQAIDLAATENSLAATAEASERHKPGEIWMDSHSNNVLLKALAKMNVMLGESRRRTWFVSEQVSMFVIPLATAIVLA